MIKKVNTYSLTISLIAFFMIWPFQPANAMPLSSFTDVNEQDWFYDNVMWGIKNKIVSGYDDGTFVPNAKITEAELLKMLINAYGEVNPNKSDTKWYAPYYRFAQDKKWDVTGPKAYRRANRRAD